LPGSPSGAQRASYHRRTAIALIVAGAAALTVAPIATARTPTVDGASSTIDSASAPNPQSADTVTYSAPWLNAEKYALYLVNCTRTGGWVTKSGGCKGYGSGHYSSYRRPLSYSSGISNQVARPYAKLLATRNHCGDYYDHDPGYRLRRDGFYGSAWGENVGCGTHYSTAKGAVLALHRMMQAEKSYHGPHWKNLKSRNYTRIGIGVWRYSGRTRLVEDFYRPG
jgi:hypothetical protein